MLIPHFGSGGDWVVVRQLARELERITAYNVRINGLLAHSLLANLASPNPMPLNQGLKGLGESWRLRHSVPRDTDVIHAHSPNALVFAWLLKRFHCKRAKIAFTLHYPVPENELRRVVKKHIFRLPDEFHAPSLASKRKLSKDYGVHDKNIRLIHLGVPTDKFVPYSRKEKRTLRETAGIPPGEPVIGYVGRLSTEKNVNFLIRFLMRQSERFPHLRCVIAGAGDCENKLREAAKSSVCANRIWFLGYTNKPQTIYPLLDLHILPSTFESFPLSVVEAAFCNVPTLRSNVGGSEDQIDDGVDGFLFDIEGGYDAFEAKLIEILDQRWSRLAAVGAASRARCAHLCDMKIYIKRMDKFYRGLQAITSRTFLATEEKI